MRPAVLSQRQNGWQVVGERGRGRLLWSLDLPTPQYPAWAPAMKCAHSVKVRAVGIYGAVDDDGYLRSFLTWKGRKVPNRVLAPLVFCSQCEKVIL